MTAGAFGEAVPTAIRLRVALLGAKPAPWRRIEVMANTTLARLHATIQAAMGWEDLHLHRFRILVRQYDPEYADLARVRLADLRLRAGERFSCLYNYLAGWEHVLRVEAVGPGLPGRRYPRCTAGRHACPPKWCPGPDELGEIKAELLGLSYLEDLDLVGTVMAAFGYARVSTLDQDLTIQRQALRAAGCDVNRRFAGHRQGAFAAAASCTAAGHRAVVSA